MAVPKKWPFKISTVAIAVCGRSDPTPYVSPHLQPVSVRMLDLPLAVIINAQYLLLLTGVVQN